MAQENKKKETKPINVFLPASFNPTVMRRTYRMMYENRLFNLFAASLDFGDTVSQEERLIILKYLWENGTFAITRSPAPMVQFEKEMDVVFCKYAVMDYDYNMRPLNFKNTPLKPSKAINSKKKFTVGKDGVLVFANEYCALHINYGIMHIARRYIDLMVNARMAQNTNLLLQKIPYVAFCDSEDSPTFKKLLEQVFGDVPALFMPKSMQGQMPEAVATSAPYIIDKLDAYITRIENMFLDEIGIDNVKPVQGGQDRLALDEANANNSMINNFREGLNVTLNEGFKQGEKLFNRRIAVKARTAPVASVHEEIRKPTGTEEKEEEIEE